MTDTEMAINVLTRAAIRISQSGRWKQCCLGRTKTGRPVPSLAPLAIGWSLRGAIHVELQQKDMNQRREDRVYQLIFRALEAAYRVDNPEGGWEVWHDAKGRQRMEVLRLVDQAVVKIKALDREAA